MQYLLLLTSLLLSIISIAQTPPSIEWGAENKGSKASNHLAMLTDDYAYVYNSKLKEFTLFDAAWNSQHKVKLSEGHLFRNFVETQAGLYALSFKRNEGDRSEGKWGLYQQKVNQAVFQEPKKLMSADIKLQGLNLITNKNAQYALAQDINTAENRIVITTTMDTEIGVDAAVYDISVYDENLKLLWRKKQEFPYADFNLELFQLLINDDGEVFMLFDHYSISDPGRYVQKSEAARRTRDGFKLFKIKENSLEEYDIELDDDVKLVSAAISTTSRWNESIALFGLYALQEGTDWTIKGSCFISYDLETKPIVNTDDLGEEFYLEAENGLNSIGDSLVYHNAHYLYRFKKVAYYTEGRFCVLAKRIKNAHTTIAPLHLLLFFDEDGELIRKQEFYTQQQELLLKDNQLFLLSQDWDKAKGASTLEKNRELKLSSFSWDGELKSEHYLMRLKHESNGLFSFDDIGKDKNGDLIFLSHKSSKFHFGKIKF